MSVDDIYVPGTVLDIPKRPPWSYSMTKEQVESQEEAMFEDYLQKIYSQYNPNRLSYFEHNLEVRIAAAAIHVLVSYRYNFLNQTALFIVQTWRQLWRVLEISDVVLLITDIRHPVSYLYTVSFIMMVRPLMFNRLFTFLLPSMIMSLKI